MNLDYNVIVRFGKSNFLDLNVLCFLILGVTFELWSEYDIYDKLINFVGLLII